jgi:lipoic acid synthetase
MGLRHVVITSVTRDDLDDGGAALFAECIRRVRDTVPGCTVEVLIPDFQGDPRALGTVVGARPEVLAHNVETVPRLYHRVRPRADYRRSLDLLRAAGEVDGKMLTKSGFMVGLGEAWDELMEVMEDLHEAGCGILTIGQYLSPTRTHLPVVRYYTPEEFDALREEGLRRGLRWVESGPFVRSSYHAETQARSIPRGETDG